MINIKRHTLEDVLLMITACVIMFITIFPILWALSTALKQESAIMSGTITLLPKPATLENFIHVWTVGKFNIYFRNSLLTAGTSLVFVVILAILNGYALARFKFRGKNFFMLALLGTQMLPILMILIPLFIIYRNIRLINSFESLIITYIITQLPFNTLLMRGFIGSIPPQVDEAATIDGASRLKVIFSVIIPVIIPGLVATAAFAFISSWNDFFVAYAFINKQELFTINVGLKFLISEYSVRYGSIAAGSIIALIPPLLLFSYVQRYLIQGLSTGAVKG